MPPRSAPIIDGYRRRDASAWRTCMRREHPKTNWAAHSTCTPNSLPSARTTIAGGFRCFECRVVAVMQWDSTHLYGDFEPPSSSSDRPKCPMPRACR